MSRFVPQFGLATGIRTGVGIGFNGGVNPIRSPARILEVRVNEHAAPGGMRVDPEAAEGRLVIDHHFTALVLGFDLDDGCGILAHAFGWVLYVGQPDDPALAGGLGV